MGLQTCILLPTGSQQKPSGLFRGPVIRSHSNSITEHKRKRNFRFSVWPHPLLSESLAYADPIHTRGGQCLCSWHPCGPSCFSCSSQPTLQYTAHNNLHATSLEKTFFSQAQSKPWKLLHGLSSPYSYGSQMMGETCHGPAGLPFPLVIGCVVWVIHSVRTVIKAECITLILTLFLRTEAQYRLHG